MMTAPPELTPDGPPPGAAWFKQLLAFAKSLQVTIDPSSGLTGTSGPGGTAIGFVATPRARVGKLTTALLERSGATPGSGTVQPYYATATALKSDGPTLKIYNWTGAAPAAGTPVKFVLMYGLWWFDGEDCSGVALP